MRFSIRQECDHTYVIPVDAAMLSREGYRKRADLPLVIQGGSGTASLAGAHDITARCAARRAMIRVWAGKCPHPGTFPPEQ